jgi:hypothetical protein
MPLNHNDDVVEVFRPANVMKPAESHATVRDRERVDVIAADPKVKKAQAKLDRMIEAQAAAPVITKARAAVEAARTAVLERHAEQRHKERSATLAKQRETIRLQAEREILYRLDQSLTPQITINFGPLQIVVTPEKSPDATLRGFAYHDVHAAMQIISTATNRAAGLSRHAAQKMEVIPADLPRLRRVLDDVMRRSIRAGLTSIEEIG